MTRSPESWVEQLSRVRMMADGNDAWDLSDSDIAALQAVLARLEALEAGIASLAQELSSPEPKAMTRSPITDERERHVAVLVCLRDALTRIAYNESETPAESALRRCVEALVDELIVVAAPGTSHHGVSVQPEPTP